MAWVKEGFVYVPNGKYSWNQSHAQVPVVDPVDDRIWRIYFGTRDRESRTRTSYIEVEAGNPEQVVYEHDSEVLPLGKLGTFDDCGVMPSWIVDVDQEKYLYYIGWTVRNTIPYHNSVGMAVSRDGGKSFERMWEGPLFSPTPTEPYFTGTSCVLVEEGVWKNWYLSCTKWELVNGRAEPFYHLKYSESSDGIHWRREGTVAIDYKSDDEGGIVKASVLKEAGLYQMWYSYRSGYRYREEIEKSYRIGYAESKDGIHWQRQDDRAGIDISESGWDSQMLAYPHVIEVGGTRYMFYNGNGFGRSGFGYARWVGG